MNTHYLELKIEQHPEIVVNKDYIVFKSELAALYGKNEKINHCCHKKALSVHKKLFEVQDNDMDALYELLIAAATKMKENYVPMLRINFLGEITGAQTIQSSKNNWQN